MSKTRELSLLSFVPKQYVKYFLESLKEKYNISPEDVMLLSIDKKRNKYGAFFNIIIPSQEDFNIRDEFTDTIIIQKKMSTLYTINALNKIIERDHNLQPGNINYREYTVEWEKYRNNIILLKNGELDILRTRRVNLDRI